MNKRTINYFTSIQEVISALELSEKAVTIKFIDLGQKQRKEGQVFKIFTEILKKPNASAQDIFERIPNATEQGFYKSLTRLKERIFESLLLNLNVKESDLYSDVFVQQLTSRKKVLIAFVLYSKGLESEGLKLLENIIDRGKKYELYDELYEVLHWIRNEHGLRNGIKMYEKYSTDMHFYGKCRDAVYEARNMYYEYYIFSDREGVSANKVERVQDILPRLKSLLDETDSNIVKYYFYLLRSELFALTRNVNECDELVHNMIQLLDGAQSLNTQLKHGVAYSDAADMMFSCGKLDKALELCDLALDSFELNSYNYFVAEEIKFKVLFFRNDFEEAHKILNMDESDGIREKSQLRQERYTFYRGCLLFKEARYRDSISVLNNLKLLERDKYGWNIAIKILIIQNFIELGEVDVIPSQIAAFRKYIDRKSKRGYVIKRHMIITTLFVNLWKNSLNFNLTRRENISCLTMLESDEIGTGWEASSPELIPFEQWFQKNKP